MARLKVRPQEERATPSCASWARSLMRKSKQLLIRRLQSRKLEHEVQALVREKAGHVIVATNLKKQYEWTVEEPGG